MIRSAFVLGLAILALATPARAAETTFRDSMGRETGRAETHNGATTYRDSMGRETGRSETNSSGTTTYRDSMGRETGRASTR